MRWTVCTYAATLQMRQECVGDCGNPENKSSRSMGIPVSGYIEYELLKIGTVCRYSAASTTTMVKLWYMGVCVYHDCRMNSSGTAIGT